MHHAGRSGESPGEAATPELDLHGLSGVEPFHESEARGVSLAISWYRTSPRLKRKDPPLPAGASNLPDIAKVANQDDLSELELLMANQTAETMKTNIAASTATSPLR